MATIDSGFSQHAPDRLVGDKAFDSDGLDAQLLEDRKIELIAPNKQNRKKARTQDGRKLRRYQRCWKVEGLFAWMQYFRRLIVRYEYHVDNFWALVQ
jgi:transposase